jgi:hypothetical protein
VVLLRKDPGLAHATDDALSALPPALHLWAPALRQAPRRERRATTPKDVCVATPKDLLLGRDHCRSSAVAEDPSGNSHSPQMSG